MEKPPIYGTLLRCWYEALVRCWYEALVSCLKLLGADCIFFDRPQTNSIWSLAFNPKSAEFSDWHYPENVVAREVAGFLSGELLRCSRASLGECFGNVPSEKS